MLNSLKRLAKDSIIYGMAELFNRALQVILLPLIFIYLNKNSFGVLDYLFAAKNLLSIFVAFGLSTAIQRNNASYSDETKKAIIPTTLFLILCIDSVINVLVYFFGDQITLKLMGEKHGTDLFLVSLTSTLFALRSIPLSFLRLQSKAFKYLLVSILYFIIYIGLTYYLISETKLDYSSFLYGGLVAIAISFLAGLYFIKEELSLKFDFSLGKELLIFGLSILAASTSALLISSINRFFLKIDGSFDDLAIFGMANRLAIFVGAILVAPFNLAWLPYVNSIYKKEGFQSTVNVIITLFTGIGLFLTLLISFFGKDLLVFLGDDQYSNSLLYVPYFCFGYLLQGYYFIASSGLFLSNQKSGYLKVSIITSLGSLLLYLLFINHLSIITVSLITMFGYLIMFISGYTYGNPHIKVVFFSVRNALLWVMSLVFIFITAYGYLAGISLNSGSTKIILLGLFLIAFVLLVRPDLVNKNIRNEH